MLDSFGNHQANQRIAEKNKDLLDQIDPTYYVGWPDTTMMEWTYQCPIGSKGHFLEEGHWKVAEKIYTHMERLSWVD